MMVLQHAVQCIGGSLSRWTETQSTWAFFATDLVGNTGLYGTPEHLDRPSDAMRNMVRIRRLKYREIGTDEAVNLNGNNHPLNTAKMLWYAAITSFAAEPNLRALTPNLSKMKTMTLLRKTPQLWTRHLKYRLFLVEK